MNALKVYSALILAVVMLLAFAYEAFPWNEPSGFKGVPFGSSEETLKGKIQITNCLDIRMPGYPERFCNARLEIGGVAVKALFLLRSGALVSVDLTFDSQDFSKIEEIFIERYGTPTSQTDDQVKTMAGATHVNRTDVWGGSLVTILLVRYSTKITESLATLTTNAEAKDLLNRSREEKKKGARDLD